MLYLFSMFAINTAFTWWSILYQYDVMYDENVLKSINGSRFWPLVNVFPHTSTFVIYFISYVLIVLNLVNLKMKIPNFQSQYIQYCSVRLHCVQILCCVYSTVWAAHSCSWSSRARHYQLYYLSFFLFLLHILEL